LKKAVVVLGYSPNQENFKEVVWGISPDKPGRIVTGLKVFLEDPEARILIITGGTEKDGKKEAEWMRDLLYERMEELSGFKVFSVFQEYSSSAIKDLVDKKLTLETGAKNTVENFQNVAKILSKNAIDSVVIVTSPDHISRAMRDAIIHWQDDFPELTRNLFGTPSVTLYSNGRMSDVVIAEPPVKRIFDLSRIFKVLKNETFIRRINNLLEEFDA